MNMYIIVKRKQEKCGKKANQQHVKQSFKKFGIHKFFLLNKTSTVRYVEIKESLHLKESFNTL